jgi:formyl-CoA transferase
MRDGILNLCRVKLRDQQRLHHGPLAEYPNTDFDDFVPRSGNASGGGQPGSALRCKPGGPNDYLYVVIQPQVWEAILHTIGRTDLLAHPAYDTAEARVSHLDDIFAIIEQWTLTKTKWDAFRELNAVDVPCGPILDTQELLDDPDLKTSGMMVEVDHPQRGTFKTVGCPFTLSDSPVQITRPPLLGEHNAEILQELFDDPEGELQQITATGSV